MCTELTSEYIKNQFLINYVRECADFWKGTIDQNNSGFFSNINKSGHKINNKKTMLTQSRNTFGLSKAFMLTGNKEYIDFASNALNFMITKFRDSENGGWFNDMNEYGEIDKYSQYNQSKSAFFQHYALLGLCAYDEVTSDTFFKNVLIKEKAILDYNLWDSLSEYSGYFEKAKLDWKNPEGKGYQSNMDAIVSHLIYFSQLRGDDKDFERLKIVADNIIERFVPSMKLFNYGFPKNYSSKWKPDLSDTNTFTGHLLNTVWSLNRIYQIISDKRYIECAEYLLEHICERAYDFNNEVCFSNYNGMSGNKINNEIEWWQIEAAFNAGITTYQTCGNTKALSLAMQSLEFYFKYLHDPFNGEVFTSVNESGQVINSEKASYWKAGYHSIEFGFNAYIYLNLFIKKSPIKLFYMFENSKMERTVKLTPITVKDDILSISKVKFDGKEYLKFNSSKREVIIPNNESGLFEVQFNYNG